MIIPNERATFETILTVDQKFQAVSNGELLSVEKNKDGTHTWHWKENFPMVAYLISFVVGEFEKVEDSYKNIPVNYWVYKENKHETRKFFWPYNRHDESFWRFKWNRVPLRKI